MNEGINAVIEDWSDMMYVAIPKIASIEPIILAKSGTDLPRKENASSIYLMLDGTAYDTHCRRSRIKIHQSYQFGH